jgi:DNA replicative helicase MCM subunit Mcm2 (Cdc46/Mcm family)
MRMACPDTTDNIVNNDLNTTESTALDNIQDSHLLDLSFDSEVNDLVELSYVKGSNLYIHLKKPTIGIVIATIMPQFSSFRKEIERQLKDKDVNKQDIKKIINLIMLNHNIIYVDYNSDLTNDTNESNSSCANPIQADQSDLTDQQPKKVNVAECIHLHSGKVQVKGNIIGISEPCKVVSGIAKSCGCGNEFVDFDPPIFKLERDSGAQCGRCKNKIQYEINYQNAIIVQLQDNEKFNDIEKLTVILLNAHTENIRIGERVIIFGRIHIRPKFSKNLLIPMVFADSVEYENKDEIVLDNIAIDANKRFVNLIKIKGRSLIPALVDMVDKSIIGNSMVKEAVLYSLVSSGNDLYEIKEHKTRNRINVLLAGNPGLGKSSLLKKTISLVRNSRYESIQHSSGKSLTAIVSREDEQLFLRLGPIPIAKGSVCGLNEIGLLKPEEQNHLLDVMEEGEFTINKHGFNSRIQSPTTIIASTNLRNPNVPEWNAFSVGDVDTKGPLSPSHLPINKQLLDRFDLIVILKDNGDFEALKEYAKTKMKLQDTPIPSYDRFLQKYLEFARKMNPILTTESKKMIEEYYISLQITNPKRESRRTLDTIIRISKAVAKLNLKEIVESEDVVHATKFYNSILFNYDGSKANIPKDPIRLITDKVMELLKEDNEAHLFIDLVKKVCIENDYARSYILGSSLGRFEDSKLSIDKNKRVRKICDLLRIQEDIEVVNKSPIKIKYRQNRNIVGWSEGSVRSDGSEETMVIAKSSI